MTNAPLGGYSGYQDGIIIGSELAPTTADRTWDGMLDDIAVFNIPLSQTQIQKVMSGDFSAFVPRPPLSINPNGANMILSWSANQPTFQLQSKTNLTSGSWANVATPPVQNGGMLEVTVPKTAGPEFFRLVGP
jgi:hypothetical protein